MEFEKVSKSFKMRFGVDCEKAIFAGMSLPVMAGEGIHLCAPLSVGGYIAFSHRTDGRFTAEFDANRKHISANVSELRYHREEAMLDFLERIKIKGATLGGADVLFKYNTGIYGGYEPLLLAAHYFFCPQPIPVSTAKLCLSNGDEEYVSLAGKRDKLLFTDGERNIYIKFPDSIAKIVLCCINEKNTLLNMKPYDIKRAVLSLSVGDYARFGMQVTEEYRKMLKTGNIKRSTKALFMLAVKLNDALGCGILKEGGIFAIVENKKTNAFIQNIKTEYEKYYGASPDFYVTRAENSGINAII